MSASSCIYGSWEPICYESLIICPLDHTNVYMHVTMWNSPIRDFWYYNIVTLLAACFRIDSAITRFVYQGTDFDIWEKVINLYVSMNVQLISCFQSSFLF